MNKRIGCYPRVRVEDGGSWVVCQAGAVLLGRSLIITSNRAPSDWYPLFPTPVVTESLLDRMINTSHQVIMNGPSYRPNKRLKNPTTKDITPTIK